MHLAMAISGVLLICLILYVALKSQAPGTKRRARDFQTPQTHARRIAQAGWKRFRRRNRNLRLVQRGGLLAFVKLRRGKRPKFYRVLPNKFALSILRAAGRAA